MIRGICDTSLSGNLAPVKDLSGIFTDASDVRNILQWLSLVFSMTCAGQVCDIVKGLLRAPDQIKVQNLLYWL